MIIDIKAFYLNTPMPRYEYMRLTLGDLPEDFIDEYKHHEKVTKDGYIKSKFTKECMNNHNQENW